MKNTLVILAVLGMMAAVLPGVLAADGATGKLVPPPAIYLPAGGKIVTEINVSDSDVLGIVKQAIPAAAETIKGLAPAAGQSADAKISMLTSLAGSVDIQGLMDAISGIKNIRILVVQYPCPISPARFIQEFDAGAGKAGGFSKILSDVAFFPGAAGVYAQPNNAGYMGFAYDPQQHVAYAVRVVGFLDVPKLITWAGSVSKLALTRQNAPVVEPGASGAAPAAK